MNSLFHYLFTSSWLLALLMLGYLLLLRNQKMLQFKRFYLLFSLFICLLHPLLPHAFGLLPDFFSTKATFSTRISEQWLPEITLSASKAQMGISLINLLTGTYLLISTILLFRYLHQLSQLWKFLSSLGFQATEEGFLLGHTNEQQPSFSFFHYVVINRKQSQTEKEYRLLLQHEKAHTQQHHSLDVLLAELAQVLFWFHPAMYLLNHALRQTHEYLADAAVLQKTGAEQDYLSLMAQQGLQAAGIPFTSLFFQSTTINRIRMIKKNTPTHWPWRIAASLLLAASIAGFVACEKQQTEMAPPPPPMAAAPGEAQFPLNADGTATEIFDVAEEEATPLGGMQAFYQHMGENMQYPQQAIDAGVEGTAYVRFVIDEKGEVIWADAIAGRLLGYGLDEEAIRVVRTTHWNPAKQGGKAVKQRKVLPVKFKL